MKKFTLRKILFVYSLVFLASVAVLCLVLYAAFLTGLSKHLYFEADAQEKQVEVLQQRIIEENHFDPAWVPPGITYVAVDKGQKIVKTNASSSDQEEALAFLKGKTIPYDTGYFVKVSYPEGTCIFKYQIGVRYSSAWANQNLPRLDNLFFPILLFFLLILTGVFVGAITHRLMKDITPLKKTVNSIGEGNLDLPVPSLSIAEFQELGTLTERMRVDLKNTLETLWEKEQGLREQTTQMLHDYRSPLTVARANSEFLKEDLSHLNETANKEQLIDYAEAIVLNLDRLAGVANRLQNQMNPQENTVSQRLCFNDLNKSLNQMAAVTSKHYGAQWESEIQDCKKLLPTDQTALKQALTNVLDNAFEHGQAPQTVRLQFTVRDSEAEYLVTNTGSHFSDNALLHGTQEGFSEKTSDETSIRGLGLYYAKRLLQESGGRLTLSNTSDGHACVKVVIPLN